MKIGKLGLAAFLAAMPAVATAQPAVNVGIGVDVNADVGGEDTYDTAAPGDPVESVDVFYDQLSPYGMWVDEPDVGRVFIPETADYVPYHTGHWQYTTYGFVWVSNDPHAWATTHYGRWAFSNNYNRWYWSPDTTWGPSWVEWRQTPDHFGWAPLGPDVIVRGGWHAPAESWHYCGSEHILDVNVGRYYEPRARVVEFYGQSRPFEHYSTIGGARVMVGPGRVELREHRVEVRPVRVEARVIGRWSPAEAHAQVTLAREHHDSFELRNQQRVEGNARIHTAQVRVFDTHPQIKVQVNARVGGRIDEHGHFDEHAPARVESGGGAHVEAGVHVEGGAQVHGEAHGETHPVPGHQIEHGPAQPTHNEPVHNEPSHGQIEHGPARPTQPEHNQPAPVHNQPAPTHNEPQRTEQHQPEHNQPAPQHTEPQHNQPAPQHTEPAHNQPAPAPAHNQPAPAPAHNEQHKEPEHHEEHH